MSLSTSSKSPPRATTGAPHVVSRACASSKSSMKSIFVNVGKQPTADNMGVQFNRPRIRRIFWSGRLGRETNRGDLSVPDSNGSESIASLSLWRVDGCLPDPPQQRRIREPRSEVSDFETEVARGISPSSASPVINLGDRQMTLRTRGRKRESFRYDEPCDPPLDEDNQ